MCNRIKYKLKLVASTVLLLCKQHIGHLTGHVWHCAHLIGEEGANCIAFIWYVTHVLPIVHM